MSDFRLLTGHPSTEIDRVDPYGPMSVPNDREFTGESCTLESPDGDAAPIGGLAIR